MHYFYTALDKSNKRITGEVEAESVKAAADILRAQSLLPINVLQENDVKKSKIDLNNIFGRVSLVERITFIKNLAVMLKSGFPVSRALTVLAEQSQNKTLNAAVGDIASQVEAGQTLASAMSKYPKIFSEMFVSIVKVGEISGNLEQALLDLSVQLDKDHKLIRKTRGAMIYPSVVIFAMVVVGIILFTFVLPKLVGLFEEFNVQLPLVTRIILGLVGFMKVYGVIVLILFIAALAGFFTSLKNIKVKKRVDGTLLKLPVIGNIVLFTNLARFSRTLASLIRSGMPIVEAVKVSGEALSNSQYREALAESSEMIRSGTPLSEALKNYPELFSPLLLNMAAVGEESGNIDSTLEEVAVFYEGEVDQKVSNLSSILEPVLMLVVGTVVAIFAMGLIMPIYSITQSI